jgi:hypothetical protein
MLSYKRARQILDAFECNREGVVGRFSLKDMGDYLKLCYWEVHKDVNRPQARASEFGTMNRYNKSDLTADDFLAILADAVVIMARHEALEHIKYNGEKIFCPHKRLYYFHLPVKRGA